MTSSSKIVQRIKGEPFSGFLSIATWSSMDLDHWRSRRKKTSLEFLRSYINNWNLLSQDPVLTSKGAEAGKSDNLSCQLVEEISSYIDFDDMSKNPNTPENLLHNHSHRLDFRRLPLNNSHLSIDFIRSHGVALNKC
ncbi:unnamed protein product [Bemisia tabaci]|uniref:Uncharacterized protein n=1 Tax=Bemisia tabaci TaxID=7038 RepID=A0A9P0A682_BEMTA|nr:unnamed protein product [Bemisia tabaci]